MSKSLEKLNDLLANRIEDFNKFDAVINYFQQLGSQFEDETIKQLLRQIWLNLSSLKLRYTEINEIEEKFEDLLVGIVNSSNQKWFKAFIYELLFNITKEHNKNWKNSLSTYIESFLESEFSRRDLILIHRASKLQSCFKDDTVFLNNKQELVNILKNYPAKDLSLFLDSFNGFFRYFNANDNSDMDEKITNSINELTTQQDSFNLEYLIKASKNVIKKRRQSTQFLRFLDQQLLDCYETRGDNEHSTLKKQSWYKQAFSIASNLGERTAIDRLKKKVSEPIDESEFAEISVNGTDDVKYYINIFNKFEKERQKHIPEEYIHIIVTGLGVDLFASENAIRKQLEKEKDNGIGVAKFLAPITIIKEDGSSIDVSTNPEQLMSYFIKKRAHLYFSIISEGIFAYYKEKRNFDLQNWLIGINSLAEGYNEKIISFLNRALLDHFSGNWIASVHILTPLVESIIFEILEENNIHFKAIIPNEGRFTIWRKTLSILDEEKPKELFGSGLILVLQVVLKDPNFLNIRNRVAHGLINPEECSEYTSFILLWLICMLSLIKGRLKLQEQSKIQNK